MTQAQQSEALRLADALAYCDASVASQAVAELRRLHAENEALRSGYDASRLEIESLRARVQELGEMLRENRSKRIVALEAENLKLLHALAAEQDANTDLCQQLEAIGAGGVEPLRRSISRRHEDDAGSAAVRLMDGLEQLIFWRINDDRLRKSF